ncbi:MAG: TetR/AcrR family transcriptional regulator [Trinickia sp.]
MSEKRNQIISAATRLFGLYGYHSVGVDWVIAEAHVTKTTMYRHFPLKTDLIVEVLQQRARACAASLEQALAQEALPLERLRKVFEWHQDWFNTEDFSGCMFAHAAAEFPAKGYPIHAAAAQQKDGLVKRIESILCEMMDEREAATLAPVLMMLLDGATLSAQIVDRKNAATEAWAVAREMVLARAGLPVMPSRTASVQAN